MTDRILQSFLRQQYTDGMALAEASDILELIPSGDSAPRQYIARFAARGLARDPDGNVVEVDGFDVGICFPDEYLRKVDASEVLTYLGPHPQPWQPNIKPPFICVHSAPGMRLVDLLYTCFDLWTWNLFYTGDEGLNHAAAQWARHQDPSRFPIDPRPLKRRTLNIRLTEKTQGAAT